MLKRPHDISYYKNHVKPNEKVYIIGKCFFASTSSKNFSECIEESQIYLETIQKELNAEHFDGGKADVDLCAAVQCKRFIQGRGYFSKLIVDIRKHLGKNDNIETDAVTSF